MPAHAGETVNAPGRELRLRILVDNQAREQGHLAQHGFAVFCEHGANRILFDTGATWEVLLRNAEAIGIDLASITDIVLSHGHGDHGGGLFEALEACPAARVWIPSGALLPRWSDRGGALRDIALSPALRNRLVMDRRRWAEVDQPTELGDGIRLTGPVPGTRPSWSHAGLFRNPIMDVPDDIPEEQALVFDTSEGMVVVVGCAHFGTPNLLAHLRTMRPGVPLRALVGGLHIDSMPESDLEEMAKAILDANIESVIPCHCSGGAAAVRLSRLGVNAIQGRVGWSGAFAI